MVFILWDLLMTREAFHTALQVYVAGAYVVFGNTIANYFAGTTSHWERFSAEGTNPDDLGIVLALGIPVALYLAGRKSAAPGGFLLKWANYAYIPASLLGIALSGSRTALIAAMPGLLFGLVSITRVSVWAKGALAALFVAAAFFITPLVPQASLQRLGTTGTEVMQGTWSGRLDIWGQGIDSLAEHPFIGVGSNMFRSVNVEGKVAHNSFLSILVELGLVGFGLFAFILLIVFTQAARQPRWDALFWFSTLAIWAIGAFALTWEYRKPTWLFLSLAIVSAALAVPRQEKAQPVPTGQQSEVKSPGAVPRPIRRQEIHIRAPQSR
jgi:O-antigen ligase